jgi:two-component system, OmpR family, osmolarity sensor histidine kinase EnvZ
MLGGISHDLRTPLARIRVALELLDVQDPALRDEMTASIDEMDRMIGQFLRYVRAGYRESPSHAVLDDVVRRCLSSYASDDRVRLELDAMQSRVFAVECVNHTLLNLVQNALQYGRAPVAVRTMLGADEIALSVEDCGDGLTEAQWSEAVRPFHRLSASPSQGHSGLGLALVQRLVSTSGGSLSSRRGDGKFMVSVHLPAG